MAAKRRVLLGRDFGSWHVISDVSGVKKKGKYAVLCRCKCGHEQLVTRTALIQGNSRQCLTCARLTRSGGGPGSGGRREPWTGRTFGDLVVVDDSPGLMKGGAYASRCRCRCGHVGLVRRQALKRGTATKCKSCYLADLTRPLSCPCGTRDPSRYRKNLKGRCRACDRRHHRNGSCPYCHVAYYKTPSRKLKCKNGCPKQADPK